jgi:hypothetical protein
MLESQPGGKKIFKDCTVKEEDVSFGGTLAGLNNEGPPFPTWALALDTLDIILVSHEVTQSYGLTLRDVGLQFWHMWHGGDPLEAQIFSI